MHKAGYQISSFLDEVVTEEFTDCLHLMEYLNKNGLSSAGKNDRNTVIRDVILGVNGVYNTLYSMPFEKAVVMDDDGKQVTIEQDAYQHGVDSQGPSMVIPASFHLVQYVGWKYHHSQVQANERGSGATIEEFVNGILEDDEEAKSRVKFGSLQEEEMNENILYNSNPKS